MFDLRRRLADEVFANIRGDLGDRSVREQGLEAVFLNSAISLTLSGFQSLMLRRATKNIAILAIAASLTPRGPVSRVITVASVSYP